MFELFAETYQLFFIVVSTGWCVNLNASDVEQCCSESDSHQTTRYGLPANDGIHVVQGKLRRANLRLLYHCRVTCDLQRELFSAVFGFVFLGESCLPIARTLVGGHQGLSTRRTGGPCIPYVRGQDSSVDSLVRNCLFPKGYSQLTEISNRC